MMNCSKPSDYYACVQRLNGDMQRRGYHNLPTIPYDHALRQKRMQSLAMRQRCHMRQVDNKYGNLLVFKADYHPVVRRMRIKARYNAVVSRLREYLGTSFLSDARFMIAYPKRTSAFMQFYRYNSLP